MSAVLYGLANCDSTRTAAKKLEQSGINFTFHDIRKNGLEKKQVEQWVEALGVEKLLNKKSTTWRELPAATRDLVRDNESAVKLILEYVTLIKRPILAANGKLLSGRDVIDLIIK